MLGLLPSADDRRHFHRCLRGLALHPAMRLNRAMGGDIERGAHTKRTGLLDVTLARMLELLEDDDDFPPALLSSLKHVAAERRFSHATRLHRLLQQHNAS